MEFMFVCVGLLFLFSIPAVVMEVFVRRQLMEGRKYNLDHAKKIHDFMP